MSSSHVPGSLDNRPSSEMHNFSLSTLSHNPSSDIVDSQRMMDGFFGKTMKDGKSKKKATGGAFASLKGAFVKQAKMDDLTRDDIIIAVMGQTGSGKSTFIDTIADLEIGVGHNLDSRTNEISTIRLAMPEVAHGHLVFVDTPGFDDTNKSDVDILKMIASWLKSTYAKDVLLAGLLYFHGITDNRMAGTPLKNLRMFEELCGKNALQNVILVTTMWDKIDGEQGEARERELKSKYWRPLLDRGSTTSRFMRTRESAFALVDPFIVTANKRISILLQQEMVDLSRQLPVTFAGRELYSKMEFLVRQRQELLDQIRNEMTRADGDNMALEPLQQEHEKLRINLEATVNKMRELKLPLGKRHVGMTEKFLGIKFKSTFFKSLSRKNVSLSEDIIIAVMGPTGSGKSTFINTITGLDTSVGSNPESFTSKINAIRRSFPELAYGDLVFVDTPGFDDTNKSDVDILKMIADWLKSTYAKDIVLAGLLYFHRITDNRMAGTPLKNLRMFEELCGKNSSQNVILVTTMWDENHVEEGEAREQELKSKYWRAMLVRGSTTSRFMGTRESSFALVNPFIEAANKRISGLLRQEVEDTRQLPATSAGHELYSKVDSLVRQRQELLDRTRNEIQRTDDYKMALESFQEEHEMLQVNLEATLDEMRKLKLPLGKRLVKMTEKLFSIKFTSKFSNSMLARQRKGVSSLDDIIIAVIGPSGSGKSTFINTITGLETGVESNVEPFTSEISTARLAIPEVVHGDLVFVDTPGFDDTNKSDADIFKMIAEWLKSSYAKDMLLSGVLYLHQISDNQMTGTPLRNLSMFKELCGGNAFQNVILVTTMWDKIDRENGEARERELISKYWQDMPARDSTRTTGRFMRTRESAFALIDPFIKAANKRFSALLQQEMVDMSRELPATSAEHELYSKMKHLVGQRQELLDRTQSEIQRVDDSKKMALEALQEQHEKLRINLEETINEMRELKLPLGKHHVQMAEKCIKFTSTFFNFMLSCPSKDDSSPDDIIIAVMGPSGSGKSTFINKLTGLKIGVGHNLKSCTHEISTIRLAMPEVDHGHLVFVDTPGFDDTNRSDVDILKMIADWLKSTYAKETLLAGLLYFHRISDNRMAGAPLRNLRMFEELCGKNALQNVILVTTMWDEIDEGVGETREQELKSKYWRAMLMRGSTTCRFMGTRESARALVDPFIEVAKKRISVLLQQEMVDMSRQLPATSAGHELFSKMELLVRQRQQLLDRIQDDIQGTEGDKVALKILQQGHETLRVDLDETVNKMRELKLPLGKRLVKMAEKSFGIKFISTFFNSMLSSDESCPGDIIIAVMGPTGSGKSTFINIITGLGTSVGHKLESSTTKVRGFRCSFPGLAGDLVFVDTPGFEFNIVNKPHVDVLKMVADWLKTRYAKDTLLSGVLYFHRITDNRVNSTPGPLKNLPEFEELCGEKSFQDVILATTMWDEIDEAEGEEREFDLKSNYWGPMLEHGSTISRFMRTRESAFTLVDPFIKDANERISGLLQQEQEMVDMNRFPADSPEHKLYSNLELLVRQRQELFDRIRSEIKRIDREDMALKRLEQEHGKLWINLEATVNEMRELKLPLGERLLKMADNLIPSRPSKNPITMNDDPSANAKDSRFFPGHQFPPPPTGSRINVNNLLDQNLERSDQVEPTGSEESQSSRSLHAAG